MTGHAEEIHRILTRERRWRPERRPRGWMVVSRAGSVAGNGPFRERASAQAEADRLNSGEHWSIGDWLAFWTPTP